MGDVEQFAKAGLMICEGQRVSVMEVVVVASTLGVALGDVAQVEATACASVAA